MVKIVLAAVGRTLGTLKSEDSDGRENVTEKVNSRSCNFHRDYSKSLTLWNVGEPSQEPYPSSERGRKFRCRAYVLPLYNVKLGSFTSQSCSDGKKKVQKSVITRKIVVFVIEPIAFVTFSLPSPWSDLKVPTVSEYTRVSPERCYY